MMVSSLFGKKAQAAFLTLERLEQVSRPRNKDKFVLIINVVNGNVI